MECVILFRNKNGRVGFISEDDPDRIAVFQDREDAIKFATSGNSPVLRVFPYQIVDLDEL